MDLNSLLEPQNLAVLEHYEGRLFSYSLTDDNSAEGVKTRLNLDWTNSSLPPMHTAGSCSLLSCYWSEDFD